MIDKILEERGNRYGEFAEHARITQEIKDTLISGDSWTDCTDSQREALEMIAHKMGRIVNGDPTYSDNFIDICGYSQLIVDELTEDENTGSEPEDLTEQFGWDDLTDFVNSFTDEILDSVTKPETTTPEPDTTDKLQQIEINGIKVLISGSELAKLDQLKESENTIEPIEHKDQTKMNFDKEDELTYQEFLKSHKR